jgi:hypothetical protein
VVGRGPAGKGRNVKVGDKVQTTELVKLRDLKVGDEITGQGTVAHLVVKGNWVTATVERAGDGFVGEVKGTKNKAVRLIRIGVVESVYASHTGVGNTVGVEVESGLIAGWMEFKKVLLVHESHVVALEGVS